MFGLIVYTPSLAYKPGFLSEISIPSSLTP